MLQECLPSRLFDRIQQAQTDPFTPAPESDIVPVRHGGTGEVLKDIPILKMHRVSRKRFRALCADGISVQFNKRLIDIEYPEDSTAVTAIFADGSKVTGTALIGADGARSIVRQILLGLEKAKPTTAPYIATRVTLQYPTAEQALEVRKLHPINSMAVHPDGIWTWISILDVGDPSKPETWEFQLMSSWKKADEDGDQLNPLNSLPLSELKTKTKRFAEPFRSANEWIPDGTPVRMNRVTYWPPIAWNSHGGRVTLAGDAAHPMTFHRGQGLNYAISDSARYVAAIQSISTTGGSLEDAISQYDAETIAKGGEEVRISVMNTDMLHQWDTLMQSPVMQRGSARNE
ncbi:MAG: hypothetical protein M1830_004384 [Pleopsidium flavum]|nr:MAG: hypothetical protein M1830_004384 [Pleopsidium flavum]